MFEVRRSVPAGYKVVHSALLQQNGSTSIHAFFRSAWSFLCAVTTDERHARNGPNPAKIPGGVLGLTTTLQSKL